MRIDDLDSTVLSLRDHTMTATAPARAVTDTERVFATASPIAQPQPQPQPQLLSANAAQPPGGTLARFAARNPAMSALLGMLAGLARSGV